MRRLAIAIVLLLGLVTPVFADGPADETPRKREHEILRERPSGFWTSNRPAEGGAYRWRLLGIGCGFLVLTAFCTWRLVKRANAHRRTQQRP